MVEKMRYRSITIEGVIYGKEEIGLMDLTNIKQLVGFTERIGDLLFIQNATELEAAKVYIDNLIYKL